MNFGLFSIPAVAAGIAALAAGLWLAQRLRVRHNEVQVLTTLFWQDALKETRARVFTRRFRHWRAWVLLVAIVSLLWMLLGQPYTDAPDSTRHVVLVDWSIEDPGLRQADLSIALDFAASLPITSRRIVAVGTHMETLLAPGEPLSMASLRSETEPGPAPRGLDWAIESLAAGAGRTAPLVIHVVGDTPIDAIALKALKENIGTARGDLPRLRVCRIAREPAPPAPGLATLGVSNSADGAWGVVDVWLAFADANDAPPVAAERITVTSDDIPADQPMIVREDGTFELRGVPANGATIGVAVDGKRVGAITLPRRDPIRVQLDADVPETLRQLITLDPACEIVATDADLRVGSMEAADLRLTSDGEPAFVIRTEEDDAQAALTRLVDELALRQIDATGIAEKSGRVVDVKVLSGQKRSLAIWSSLFTPAFDFQESRACPLMVSRALRWLAHRPPLIEWAALGERLPAAAPAFSRAEGEQTVAADGRILRTTPLMSTVEAAATLPESEITTRFAWFGPYTWMGLLAALLLVGEWVLYQRGRMP